MRRLMSHAGPPLLALSLAVAGAAGCEQTGDGPEPQPEGEPESEPEAVTIQSLEPAANDETVHSPFDATLSPDGTTAYYVALSPDAEGEDVAGVFSVPAQGGTPIALASGDPLSQPVNVDVSLDGATLYIADGAALEDEETSSSGAVFALDAAGGTPSAVDVTLGLAPTGVVVQRVDDAEYVYFSGRTDDEVPAVFRFVRGGTLETLHEGAPLDAPGGLAVTAGGTVYVVDSAPGSAFASLVRIEAGAATVLLDDIGVGYPAGCALSLDDAHLWISGLHPEDGTDRVYRYALGSGRVGLVEDGINAFSESAGLHRAHDADVFAWADSEANDTGTVYVLVP